MYTACTVHVNNAQVQTHQLPKQPINHACQESQSQLEKDARSSVLFISIVNNIIGTQLFASFSDGSRYLLQKSQKCPFLFKTGDVSSVYTLRTHKPTTPKNEQIKRRSPPYQRSTYRLCGIYCTSYFRVWQVYAEMLIYYAVYHFSKY